MNRRPRDMNTHPQRRQAARAATDPTQRQGFGSLRVSGLFAAAKWPPRPGDDALCGAIPLFYIAQDNNAFWVARDAEGRVGGTFLLQQSALHFARQNMRPVGGAIMFLSERLDLDVENQGNLLIAPLAFAKRTLKILFNRPLFTRFRTAHAEMRRHRAEMEKDLFGGNYKFSTKNDDDLPSIR